MKRAIAITCVLMFLVCSGCGDTRESLAKDALSTLKEMTAVLEGVKDEASADSAMPKLKSLVAHMNDLSARQAKMPAATPEETKAIKASLGTELEEVQRKFMAQMMRIMGQPKLQARMQEALQGLKPPGR